LELITLFMESDFAWLLVTIFVVMLFFFYTKQVDRFLRKRRYLKMELKRSSSAGRARWKRRLRRNYLNLIPFVHV